MTRIVVDITVSLDGFVTAPNAGPGNGLGDDGVALHTWAIGSKDPVDTEVLRRAVARTGAIVMGRRTYDVIDAPDGWGEGRGYGAGESPAQIPPVFVPTHDPPAETRLDIFSFAPSAERAVELAREAAGDRDVYVMGGGDTCRQVLEGGWADELVLHLSPFVLGGGTPLFRAGGPRIELEQVGVEVSANATHITYRIR